MYQLSTRPQTIWEIMSDSFRLYRVAFLRLIFWAFVMGAVNFLSSIYTATTIPVQTAQTSAIHGVFQWSSVYMPIAVMFLSLIPAAAMMFDIHQTMHQKNPTIQAAFTRAVKKLLPMVGIIVIACIAMALLSALILALHIAGFIIMFVISSYLLVACFAWFPLIVTENQSISEALENSFKIIKGNWWRTFLLVVMFAVVVVVVNVLVSLIFSGSLAADPKQPVSLLQMLVNVVATVIFMPWLYGGVLLQIHNLELRAKKTQAFEKVLEEHENRDNT